MKVCFFTATRAEYGFLKPVMQLVKAHGDMTLQLIAGGTHFTESFGNTYKVIEADGFTIDARAPMDARDDSASGVFAAISDTVKGIGAALEQLKPDAFVFLGDRYEILAAAMAGAVARVPMVHIFGGEATHGAFDEQFRHALTKLSHIHCAPTEEAAERIRQMGENPRDVFVTGHPALGSVRDMTLMERDALAENLGVSLDGPVYLLGYHPETLTGRDPADDLLEVLKGVAAGIGDATLIMTRANADPGHNAVNAVLEAFAAERPNTKLFPSLGQVRYYSLLKIANALIGNSSSGIHEAPSFGLHTINIGTRQQGRTRASSIIDVAIDSVAIADALKHCQSRLQTPVVNPYECADSSEKVIAAISSLKDKPDILIKTFHRVGP